METKLCSKCRETKPVAEFRPDPRMTNGLRSQCRHCEYLHVKDWKSRNPDKVRAQSRRAGPKRDLIKTRESGRRYYHKNPALAADRQRRNRHGAPLGMYAKLLAEQNGRCAICGEPPTTRQLALDHCHASGKIRGLLCHSCNVAIGHLNDDPALLRAAALYIEEHLK